MNQSDEQERNLRNFRKLFDEAFTKGNVAIVDELVSSDLIEHMAMPRPSREGLKDLIRSLHVTFPDFICELQDVAVDGDKVWGRVKGGGTDLGGFMGHQATMKRVSTGSIDLCRFRDGKIIEHWGIVDMLGLMAQLGLIPGQGDRSLPAQKS